MPRIRSIYPEACRSRKLAALTPAAERCWWRLQVHLDDYGRSEDEPDIFASVLFQVMRDVTPGMVDRWLWEMADAGLIERYEVDGTNYLQVVRWGDFQHPQRPKASAIPPAQGASTRRVRDTDAMSPRLFRDGGGVDGMGADKETEGEPEGEPAPHADPVDISSHEYNIRPEHTPAANGLLGKLDHLRVVHSEHYPQGSVLPDRYTAGPSAPASPLAPSQTNHQGAENGNGAA